MGDGEQVARKLVGEINWGDVLPQLYDLIRECLTKTSKDKVVSELSRPGLRVTARLRKMYRRQGYRRGDLRRITSEAVAELRSSSKIDIQELIAEATEDDEDMEGQNS